MAVFSSVILLDRLQAQTDLSQGLGIYFGTTSFLGIEREPLGSFQLFCRPFVDDNCHRAL